MNKMKVGIIGAGNMGSAIVAGIHSKLNVAICEQDKRRCSFLKRRFKIKVLNLDKLIEESNIIILAVKPQSFEELLSLIKQYDLRKKLFVSIAAGITTKYIEKGLGQAVKVIRTMPNLPAQILKGVTGICKGKNATVQDLKAVRTIFSFVGETLKVEEKQMDALTAVSGSGPAYLFHFVECLEDAAKAAGFTTEISKQLIYHTIRGSIELLGKQNEGAAELRCKVTSKGGTTQAALDVLMGKNVNKIYRDAVKAASNRSKQLSR